MKKKILILGGSGFIGRNLKEFLEKQNDLYYINAPSRQALDVSCEQTVKRYLTEQRYDVVIHAAVFNPRTGTGKNLSKELDMNLRMFFNLEKYKHLFGKMLYFGSGAELDKRRDIIVANEDENEHGIPSSDYGLYKYIVSKSITCSPNIYNLRLFGLFGKYENWKKAFISGACCKALKNLPITIRQNVYFDYLYIDDFCEIVNWFINNEISQKTYNVTSGKKIDLLTIVDIIRKISKKDVPVFVCTEGIGKEYTASNDRLIGEMGGLTLTPMEDSIKNLYDWYLEQEASIDILSLLYQE